MHAEAVRDAWVGVGVEPVAGSTEALDPEDGAGEVRQVRVRRSGGFIGTTVEAVVDLDSDDERAAPLRDLVPRVDLHQLSSSRPMPDHFTYEFDLDGEPQQVLEQDLTPELRSIADLVLRRPEPPTS